MLDSIKELACGPKTGRPIWKQRERVPDAYWKSKEGYSTRRPPAPEETPLSFLVSFASSKFWISGILKLPN
jgi:hypothetical protein